MELRDGTWDHFYKVSVVMTSMMTLRCAITYYHTNCNGLYLNKLLLPSAYKTTKHNCCVDDYRVEVLHYVNSDCRLRRDSKLPELLVVGKKKVTWKLNLIFL